MKGKVAFLKGPRNIEIKEYDLPKLNHDELLLKVRKANVCGSDLHIWKGDHPVIKKCVLGHEMLGEVYDLGKNVKTDYAGQKVEKGDRVVSHYLIACLKCQSCLNGDLNLCENGHIHWAKNPEEYPHFFGAFATHYLVQSNKYFYKVPESVPDSSAAGANCALAQAIFSLDQINVSGGDYLLIQGAGGLGLNTIAVAKERGAIIIVLDGIQERLELAEKFGAHYTLNINEYENIKERVEVIQKISGQRGVDIAIEAAGSHKAFCEGLEMLRPAGTYLCLGNIPAHMSMEIPPGIILRKGLKIFGMLRYYPWYLYKALKFLERYNDNVPYDLLTDKQYRLEEVTEALEKTDSKGVARAVIAP